MKFFSHTFGSCSSLEKDPMQVSFLSNTSNKNKPKKQATDIALGETTA